MTKLPVEIATIFESLQNDLMWIHGRWILYRQLYGTNKPRVELLDATAGTFFSQLQILWLDYVILEICRISDPTKTYGKENLVIGQIAKNLNPLQHRVLIDRLEELKLHVDTATADFRTRRNKRIVHSDLAHATEPKNFPIPGFSEQSIEDALNSLRNYLNEVDRFFTGSAMVYEGFVLHSDGDQLIYALKCASEFKSMADVDNTLFERIDSGEWKDA
jgi:hypothetical protein